MWDCFAPVLFPPFVSLADPGHALSVGAALQDRRVLCMSARSRTSSSSPGVLPLCVLVLFPSQVQQDVQTVLARLRKMT